MAYVHSAVPHGINERSPGTLVGGLMSAFGEAGKRFRKQWVYRRTLSELQAYSQRSLEDLGAHKGVEDFARRAAGLE